MTNNIKENSPFNDPTYKVPTKPNGYAKLQLGSNKYRIMCDPIKGYEYWITNEEEKKSPTRTFSFDEVPAKYQIKTDSIEPARHFWAMIVYEYSTKSFAILEITQPSIQKGILDLVRDESWGNPIGTKGYDINIIKTGSGMNTRYSVNPTPPKTLPIDITMAYEKTHIDLNAWMASKDPFSINSKAEEIFNGDNQLDINKLPF